ncbi:LADA_0H03466g1_1 [Lachancea dasiensis]|uniref:LADA_0H03466g1_1 n=1 Tax=Lachancea dasiensis TaxID=1072105 RepID=A0A1G4K078_9SACH|nr:LADA_0H03466g1_1 [Lachancea dasiensis]
MTYITPPLFANRKSGSLLMDEVTQPLNYSDNRDRNTDAMNRNFDIGPPREGNNYKHSELKKTLLDPGAKVGGPSSQSLVNSASDSSFRTAHSQNSNLNESKMDAVDANRRFSTESHYSDVDQTPIVAPNAAFDISTPRLAVEGFSRDVEPGSPDSFTFVDPSLSNTRTEHKSDLDTLSFSTTAGGLDRGLNTAYRSENPDIKGASPAKISPSKIALSARQSPRKLARSSIYEAHSKEPIDLPNGDDSPSPSLRPQQPNLFDNDFNGDDTTMSHDDTYMRELTQINKNETKVERKHTFKRSSELDLDESNLAYLFIIALHSFNSQTLKNEDDVNICLSFEKNDVAFVHTVDESGWGEVTLLRGQKRGWVPFNYFSDMVKACVDSKSPRTGAIAEESQTRTPLTKLLSSSARFLLHPRDFELPNRNSRSFSFKDINGIRDGVKFLLEATGCVSRSNELVKNKANLKKARKLLLADWYNLMIKADSYKYTTDESKVSTLVDLTFQVLRRGLSFYDTWHLENEAFENERKQGLAQPLSKKHPNLNENTVYDIEDQSLRPVTSHTLGCQNLASPPFAVQRLNEVHDLIFSYIGVILGRLDLLEHNAAGCEVLESIVHQIIVLLRELLYISKCCSSVIQDNLSHTQKYEVPLERSLDPLLALVSELVSCIKLFVTQSMSEAIADTGVLPGGAFIKDEEYFYTDEGKHLMTIISKMTGLISVSVRGCHHYLKVIGNFQLGKERAYPDFQSFRISPEQFIRRCSIGLVKKIPNKRQEGNGPHHSVTQERDRHPYAKKLYRYSMVRAGRDGYSLTASGTQLLQDIVPDSVSFLNDTSFEKFKLDDGEAYMTSGKEVVLDKERVQEELVYDVDNKLVGASNRAFVYLITNELDPPNEFILSTYLLNFRSFSNALELISELITRFDITDKSLALEKDVGNGQYSSRSSRLKNRRRLVCKVFQTWLQSYWDYQSDFTNLATLVNFFNEGISIHLPIEARTLIEVASELTLKLTSLEYTERVNSAQTSPRDINIPSRSSIISLESLASSKRSTMISVNDDIMDEYELTKLPSASTSSISLPLPLLNIGTSSLLSRRQLNDMERIINGYYSKLYPSRVDKTMGSESSLNRMLARWSALIKNLSTQVPPPNLIHNDLNLVDLNPLEVAKQLSLIESALFLAVKPGELLIRHNSSKSNASESSSAIEAIIDFSNLLSNYVIESLVSPKLSYKLRLSRLKAWLNIALSALYFRNYNSLATIMTSLQSSAISRLSFLWEEISDKYAELFHYLSKIVHPNKNYKIYRTKLHKLATGFSPPDNICVKSQVPSIPYFALFLQDLTLIQEGLHDFRDPTSFRPNKIVNIDKYTRITKVLSLVQFFQVPFDVDEKPNFLGSKRDSFFNLSNNARIDTTRIQPVALLQEFILYEFWRNHLLYLNDNDRGYNLSLALVPRSQ